MAWSYILDSTPMMANPHEYRELLWTVLHDGKDPPKKAPLPTTKGERKALPRAGGGMTSRDKNALADFMKQIDEIKAKQDPDTASAAS